MLPHVEEEGPVEETEGQVFESTGSPTEVMDAPWPVLGDWMGLGYDDMIDLHLYGGFPKIVGFPPKSSNFIGFSIFYTHIFGETPI